MCMMEKKNFYPMIKLHFPGSSGLTLPASPIKDFFSYQPTSAALHHII